MSGVRGEGGGGGGGGGGKVYTVVYWKNSICYQGRLRQPKSRVATRMEMVSGIRGHGEEKNPLLYSTVVNL